jgi:NADPH:quinone reductase-like Zn-dependent oxidoreductase
MKAIVRTQNGPPREVLQLTDVGKPVPDDDQVLVHVRAASVNRADYYAVTVPALVMKPMMKLMGEKTNRVGGDYAGVVEAVGKDVDDFKAGDEVYGTRTGSLAEYLAVKKGIERKPANLTFEEAAALPIAAITALQAIRDYARLQPGQTVLVNGASGGVGTFAVQIAKALGAGRVDAVCRTRNVDMVRSLGADRVFDYTQEDFTRSGERYDVIIDVAGSKPWSATSRVLEPKGTLVLVGAQKGNRLLGPLGHIIATKFASIWSGRKCAFFVAKITREDLTVLRELVEAGKVKPVVERTYPLSEAIEALEYMGEGHARGKVAITID